MISLAGGTLWLVVAGSGFAVAALIWIGTPTATAALVGVVALACVLVGINVRAMRTALRLPGNLPPLTPEEQTIMRGFLRVLIAEVVAIIAVNWLCAVYRRFGLIGPLDIVVVGLHFIPLARILRIPRYYATGRYSA